MMIPSETVERGPVETSFPEPNQCDRNQESKVVPTEACLKCEIAISGPHGSQVDTAVDTVSDTFPNAQNSSALNTRFDHPFPFIALNTAGNVYQFDSEKENVTNVLNKGKVASGRKPLRKRCHEKRDDFSILSNHLSPISHNTLPHVPISFTLQTLQTGDLIRDSSDSTILPACAEASFHTNENFLGDTVQTKRGIPPPPELEPSFSTFSRLSFLGPLSRQVSNNWLFHPSFSRQTSMAFPFSRQTSMAVPTPFSRQNSRVTFELPYMPDRLGEYIEAPAPLLYSRSSRMGTDLMSQPIIASPYPVFLYPSRQHGSNKEQDDCLTPPNSMASFRPSIFSTLSKDSRVDEIPRYSYELQATGYHQTPITAVTTETKEKTYTSSTKHPATSPILRKKPNASNLSQSTTNLLSKKGPNNKVLVILQEARELPDPDRMCTCPNSRYVSTVVGNNTHISSHYLILVSFYSCLKLYCVCFQSGNGCSKNCRCKACENNRGSFVRDKAIKDILFRRPDAFEFRERKTGEGCSCKKNRYVST